MKYINAKTRKATLLAVLAFAAIWDGLCLAGILPIDKWPVSTGVICIWSLFTQIPLLFSPAAQKEEKPAPAETVRKKDRIFAGLLIGLAVIWVVASIVCLFVS